jgi:hypothetical protein
MTLYSPFKGRCGGLVQQGLTAASSARAARQAFVARSINAFRWASQPLPMRLLCAFLLSVLPLWPHAQPVPRSTDAQIMREARLVVSSERVDLYEHRVAVDPELANASDQAIARMESILGRRWDTATLGDRVSIYVSSETRVSHVLGGYEHQNNPRAVLFLNPVVARMAVSGKNRHLRARARSPAYVEVLQPYPARRTRRLSCPPAPSWCRGWAQPRRVQNVSSIG